MHLFAVETSRAYSPFIARKSATYSIAVILYELIMEQKYPGIELQALEMLRDRLQEEWTAWKSFFEQAFRVNYKSRISTTEACDVRTVS